MNKSTGWKLFMRAATARAYPRVIGANRELSWLLFEIVIPLINTAAFVFLYRSLNAPEAYIGFVVLGDAMAAYWLNVLWMMASQLYWDKQEGFLELYIMAPISLMSILLGMGVGGLYMSTIRAATIAIVGALLFNVQFDASQWGFALLVFLSRCSRCTDLGCCSARSSWCGAARHGRCQWPFRSRCSFLPA